MSNSWTQPDPCPFCGNNKTNVCDKKGYSPPSWASFTPEQYHEIRPFAVRCRTCGARGPKANTPADAIFAFNQTEQKGYSQHER